MKRTFTILSMLLFSVIGAIAQTSTTDCYTISPVDVNPGNSTYTLVTVNLSGSTIYSACQVTVTIPEGYTYAPVKGAKYVKFPSGSDLYEDTDHGASANVDPDNKQNLIISISDNDNTDMTATSGGVVQFGVVANSWVKTGSTDIKLSGIKFIKSDGSQFVHDDQTASAFNVTTACTLPIPAGWSTCVFPFTPASLPSGVKVYDVASVSGSTATLAEASTIGDYKPYIVKAEAAATLTGTITATYPTGVKTNGLLNGVVTATEITSDYVLQNQGAGEGFYKVNSAKPVTVPMGKAYLSGSASPVKADVIMIEVPTAIKSVEAAADNDNVYNLNGVKVTTPQRGIYIKGGKKVVMK